MQVENDYKSKPQIISARLIKRMLVKIKKNNSVKKEIIMIKYKYNYYNNKIFNNDTNKINDNNYSNNDINSISIINYFPYVFSVL